jgi:ribosomal protein S9
MSDTVKYVAVGRRKESVARVQLIPGKGEFRVNRRPMRSISCGKPIELLFSNR